MKTLLLTLAILIIAYGAHAPAGVQATNQQTGASPSQQPPAEKKPADCGCEAKAPPDVLAIVNGAKIAIKDVDEPIKERIKTLQDQVIEARKRELDLQINSRLLESEARRLGITTDQLLERDVSQRVKPPTEDEARTFYDQNKTRIQGEFKDLKDQIVNYLRDQRQRDEAKKFADGLRVRAQVKVLVENVTPPDTDAARARVLAMVNGKQITSGDVEDALKPLRFSVQEQVYELRKQQLESKMNDYLLEQEAKRANVSPTALFDSEVGSRTQPVTEEDARNFYEENKGRVEGTFDQLRAQIIEHLKNRAKDKALNAFAEKLRKGAAIQVFLEPPEPPVFDIAIDDRPWRGAANAPVTIVQFTDYECPSCATAHPVLEELVKEFGDKVKLVSRNYPLDQHKHAFKAAEAAEAAREQGKYWEYAAILFKNQKALEVDKLKEYAGQLGLDRKIFDAALDSGKFADKVKRDLADGDKIGVDSTPTVFINGRKARDKSREALKMALEAALKDTPRRKA
jgi:protein-disulfide isomerase